MTKVAGNCPMGCGQTLFLADGGYVTCSWHACPAPAAADEMLLNASAIRTAAAELVEQRLAPGGDQRGGEARAPVPGTPPGDLPLLSFRRAVFVNVGSVCSGAGFMDLGFHRAGHRIVWFCEADPYRRRVLARHFPGVPVYPDLTTLDAAEREPIDLLAGGTPCPDWSVAGKRAVLLQAAGWPHAEGPWPRARRAGLWMSATHECPVDGCAKRVVHHHLMCARHWRLVSPNLQTRLYDAYDHGRGAGSDLHREVRALSVDEVNYKLARGDSSDG